MKNDYQLGMKAGSVDAWKKIQTLAKKKKCPINTWPPQGRPWLYCKGYVEGFNQLIIQFKYQNVIYLIDDKLVKDETSFKEWKLTEKELKKHYQDGRRDGTVAVNRRLQSAKRQGGLDLSQYYVPDKGKHPLYRQGYFETYNFCRENIPEANRYLVNPILMDDKKRKVPIKSELNESPKEENLKKIKIEMTEWQSSLFTKIHYTEFDGDSEENWQEFFNTLK